MSVTSLLLAKIHWELYVGNFNREVRSPTVGLAAEWNASSTLLSYPDNLRIVYQHMTSLYHLCIVTT